MATKKTSVSPILPEKQPQKQSEKLTAKDIHRMSLVVEGFYLDMEKKKLASCHDLNSQSDFHNLHRDAEQYKNGLREWYKYLEG